ncbi:uncharacterized protein LOC132258514 [Phlebotomus argentipes]|uniref:uncharacterized protein LOC132258514 n=1 Tax=Phlebotomus argentipes TaxID=94469 RepID=UPI00289376B4|nr:uncharacterized protein LOC132258514 [Phlebotomus argentipes]
MISICLLATLLAACLFFKPCFDYFRTVAKLWHMPVVNAIPFLGCSVRFFRKKDEDLFSELVNIVESVETPSNAAFLGPLCHVFITHHEDVKTLLTSPDSLDKTYHYRYLFNETNLLVVPGHVWRVHRKLLNPHFTSPVVHTFIPLFNAKTDILAKKMLKTIADGEVDIRDTVHNCFLDMICATTFGVDLNLQEGNHQEFSDAIDNYAKMVARRFFNVYLQVDWIFSLTADGKLYHKSLNILHEMTKKVVEEHIKTREAKAESSSANLMHHVVNLLEEGQFTEGNLYDTVEIMILAGFETAAVTMLNVLLILAMHPDVQERCFEEILRVCGSDGDVTSEEVTQLQYVEMVIKETMRLFPVAPLIGRKPTKDIQLRNCVLPKGVHTIILTYILHRDPKVWGQDSNEFKPDRFQPENFSKIPYYSYVPFSAGSRNCIGPKYAMLVMKIVLVKVLRRFAFFTARPLKMCELKCAMYTTIKIMQIKELRAKERQLGGYWKLPRRELKMGFLLPVLLSASILLILASIKEIRKSLRAWWLLRKFPYVRGLPILGSALAFIGRDQEDYLEVLMEIVKDIEGPTRVYLGPQVYMVISTPEDVKTLTMTTGCLNKLDVYRFFHCPTGLATAPGPIWKTHRRLLTPSFNTQTVQTFLPIFNDKAKIMLSNLHKVTESGERDFLKYIYYCTLEMICETTLGTNIDVQNGKNLDYFEAVEMAAKIVGKRFFQVWLYLDSVYKRTKQYAEEMRHFNVAYRLSSSVIEEKKQEYLTEMSNESETKPNILINRLIKLMMDKELGLDEVKDEVDTMIAAGHDTSALTISFALLMLAIHQDVQDKVLEEMLSINPSPDAQMTFEDATKLTYTEMVIKETMRLFPILPISGRICTEDTKFSNGTIPAGTNLLLFGFRMHRSKSVWGPRANDFYPDHFLPENVAKRHPYSYVPFGGGLRNCIGNKYAMLSMKTILSAFLKNFRVTVDGVTMADVKPSMLTTMQVRQTEAIRISKRKLV